MIWTTLQFKSKFPLSTILNFNLFIIIRSASSDSEELEKHPKQKKLPDKKPVKKPASTFR